jgi:hypothetical protein
MHVSFLLFKYYKHMMCTCVKFQNYLLLRRQIIFKQVVFLYKYKFRGLMYYSSV